MILRIVRGEPSGEPEVLVWTMSKGRVGDRHD